MNTCIHCGNETKNPRFCSRSCSATVNNREYPKRRTGKKPPCLQCESPVTYGKKYCSILCQIEYQKWARYNAWTTGKISGLGAGGNLLTSLKSCLREIRGDKCERCGWAEVSIYTNVVPIETNHIDGNYKNNRPENIELLCPNCHSLTKNYRGLNRGKGRERRMAS